MHICIVQRIDWKRYTKIDIIMSNYLHKHRHVFADNSYTSVDLAEDLLQADTYFVGRPVVPGGISRKLSPMQRRKLTDMI